MTSHCGPEEPPESAELGDQTHAPFFELGPFELETSNERLEPNDIAGSLTRIGTVDGMIAHCRITLGVVVEVLVIDELFAGEGQLVLDVREPITDGEQLAFAA